MSYQAMKKVERDLRCILLSERSHSKKVTVAGFQIYDILKKVNIWRIEWLVVAGGKGRWMN